MIAILTGDLGNCEEEADGPGLYGRENLSKVRYICKSSNWSSICSLERLDEAIKILRKIAKANDGKRKKFCLNMLEYLEKQWLNGNVPREVWNMYLHKGVTTNNHAEGYNYKMGAKNKICKHPNPYTLADVIRSELTEGCDTATSKKK